MSDVISLFRGLAQTAIVQSTLLEWQKLPKGELACLDRALLSQGESVRALVQQGIQPTDRRISDLRTTCLNQSPERVVSGEQSSIYVVDGLQLGAKVQPNSSAHSEYRCQPSEQFVGLTWCQKQKATVGPKGPFEVTGSILHSADGTAVYVNQHVRPAFFSGSDVSDQIDRLSKKFGQSPNILQLPNRAGLQRAIIASWGNILLEKLGDIDLATLASGVSPKSGILIDFLGDFQKSAKAGLPVFRLTGADGYVWSASYEATGRGHLRFFEANARQFATASATADARDFTEPGTFDKSIKQLDTSTSLVARQSSSLEDSSGQATTETLAAENRRLVEAQKAAAEEFEKQRIANAEAEKSAAQAVENAKREAEQAKKEAERAKQAAEEASENARQQTQLYLTITGGVAFVLAISLAFSARDRRQKQTDGNALFSSGKAVAPAVIAAKPEIQNDHVSKRPLARSKGLLWIIVSIAGFSYALVPEVRSFVHRQVNALSISDRFVSLPKLKTLIGPNLKVWTQEVYLDATATKPIHVLHIQSRMDNPIILSGVSVNDDPKCFPEYASSGLNGPINDVAALNSLTNGIMQIMLASQGINILRSGYNKPLKLGEIEKISLGSPSFGGCTPVKVVVTTDHGSSTFNFD